MLAVMGAIVVLFNALDNLTTFLCLSQSEDCIEANPVAAWLFDSMGLVNGLVLEMSITALAVIFLVVTNYVPRHVKVVLLTILTILPAWASLNNMYVMDAIGISFSF